MGIKDYSQLCLKFLPTDVIRMETNLIDSVVLLLATFLRVVGVTMSKIS